MPLLTLCQLRTPVSSRVHYGSTSLPSDPVWVQPSDGCCRWRQSGGWLDVLTLKVPPGVPTAQLEVAIEMFRLTVRRRDGGDCYLEGERLYLSQHTGCNT